LDGSAQGRSLTQFHETAHQAGRLFEAASLHESVYVVCEGWGFRFRRFEDGRRYILNFVIPGDVVYGDFSEYPGFSIQALTDIRYCKFVRAEVEALISSEQRVSDAWTVVRIAERAELSATAATLAQFNAVERVAHLILQLRNRLDARGMVQNESFTFPLRQGHIADATGLTAVHVSRTLGTFRKDGIVAIGDGNLTILNLMALRRIVEHK
jgi:CRP/FNR family transcriptional regulator, anaerobic regulatory protein